MRPTTVKGKRLYEVTWLVDGECDGCCFHRGDDSCPNSHDERCDAGGPMEGKIYIPRTKKGIADYVEARLSHD